MCRSILVSFVGKTQERGATIYDRPLSFANVFLLHVGVYVRACVCMIVIGRSMISVINCRAYLVPIPLNMLISHPRAILAYLLCMLRYQHSLSSSLFRHSSYSDASELLYSPKTRKRSFTCASHPLCSIPDMSIIVTLVARSQPIFLWFATFRRLL